MSYATSRPSAPSWRHCRMSMKKETRGSDTLFEERRNGWGSRQSRAMLAFRRSVVEDLPWPPVPAWRSHSRPCSLIASPNHAWRVHPRTRLPSGRSSACLTMFRDSAGRPASSSTTPRTQRWSSTNEAMPWACSRRRTALAMQASVSVGSRSEANRTFGMVAKTSMR